MMTKHKGLIQTILDYSCSVEAGDRIVIEYLGHEATPFVKDLIQAIYEKKAIPRLIMRDEALEAGLLKEATEVEIQKWLERDLSIIDGAQVYIMIKAPDGSNALGQITPKQMACYQKAYYQPFYKVVLSDMRWVSLRYPSIGLAKNASMSLSDFQKTYFDLCETDYRNLSSQMDALMALMKKTDKVRILGQGTDLSLSIKGQSICKSDGRINLPDGEVYMSPLKSSVSGKISFNVASYYQGKYHEEIVLTFENGRVIWSSAKDSMALKEVLDTDEGASYIGEFAFGLNPKIEKPLGDILFDEKVYGSIHLALGNCYEVAPNGNSSAIHWDLVLIQTPEYGGGEIYFDDVLVRKDGEFLLESLKGLNR